MKASEILRKLADVIDSQEQARPMQSAQLDSVDVDTNDHTDTATMVPPLQQKLELLKKAAGVDSYFDDDDDDECGCQGHEEDELAVLKRNAGMPVIMQASEDNDILG